MTEPITVDDEDRIDPYGPYRKQLLDPRRVRELSRPRPWRAAFDAVVSWAVIVAAWAVVAHWPRWWTVLLAIPVIGTRYYALWIIGHDGLHRRLFANQSYNDVFADLAVYGPVCAITRIDNRNHLDHHTHLATALDPDRFKNGSYNKTTRIKLLMFLTGMSTVGGAAQKLFATKSVVQAAVPSRRPRKMSPRDLVILLVWQAALVGGLTAAIGWWAWPVLWLLPVYAFTFLADTTRAFIEHSHPEDDALADRHRLVTVVSNPFERIFFAPLHMNLHATHHLWPSIPYYNLPIAEREMRALPAARDLPMRASYVGYLWTYFRSVPFVPERKTVVAETT